MSNPDSISAVKTYLLSLQDRVCTTLTQEDTVGQFFSDPWVYTQGEGGGISRVMTQGAVIESGAVHFSHISADSLPPSIAERYPEYRQKRFQALGLSIIIHPQNPYVPITHMNLRLFYLDNDKFWFGGGFDLTPCYGFDEDCQHWHSTARNACLAFGDEVYPHYKAWCDRYFHLKHRQEQRGIGGIFFDDLNHWPIARCFDFIRSIGDHFLLAYIPIVQRRKTMCFTQRERDFQLYRRGRYVEFNLLYDQGTLFGLQSAGRVESILSSLPTHVIWRYNWKADPGTPEAELLRKFLIVRDWV